MADSFLLDGTNLEGSIYIYTSDLQTQYKILLIPLPTALLFKEIKIWMLTKSLKHVWEGGDNKKVQRYNVWVQRFTGILVLYIEWMVIA